MSAQYKPGDTAYIEFTTQTFSTGAASNASSITGTVNRNGTDDGAVTVTVTNIDTGRYKAVFTIPATYVPGDVLNLTIAATDPNSVAGKAAIWSTKLGWGTVRSGTAQAGGASTITLDAGASATDNLYQDSVCLIVAGTGAGQQRSIQSYVGSTKVATVFPAWTTQPDSTSVFVLLPFGQVDVGNWLNVAPNALASGRVDAIPVQRANTATAGTSTTLTLDAGASAVDNYYTGSAIVWTSGANIGVVRSY